MKWEDLRRSKNVQDRRGRSSGSGLNSSGGGISPLLLMLLSGRGGKFGIIAIVLLLIFGGGLSGLFDSQSTTTTDNSISYQESRQVDQDIYQSDSNTTTQATDSEVGFLSAVLGSTEDFWGEI